MTVDDFVKWIYPHAKKTDINPIFVTAQAALESGWGKSAIGLLLLGQRYNFESKSQRVCIG